MLSKKIVISSLFMALVSMVNGQSVDYTQGNTNPFAHYEYKSTSEWEKIDKQKNTSNSNGNVGYISNRIQNPLSAVQQKKYRSLISNASQVQGCWDKAASIYNVDPWMLMAIAKTESSFNSTALNVNSNRSFDIGMMQINSSWLPTLKRFGIEKEHLLNPCTSVFVGAWILAQNIQHFGYNQDGIGAYNSPGNITIRRNYAKKVYSNYRELVSDLYVSK